MKAGNFCFSSWVRVWNCGLVDNCASRGAAAGPGGDQPRESHKFLGVVQAALVPHFRGQRGHRDERNPARGLVSPDEDPVKQVAPADRQ
jgi:hypothetical protein